MNVNYLKEVTGHDLKEITISKNGVEKEGITVLDLSTNLKPIFYPPENMSEIELADWLKKAIENYHCDVCENTEMFLNNMTRGDFMSGLRIGLYKEKGGKDLISKPAPQMDGIIQYLYYVFPSSNDNYTSKVNNIRLLLEKHNISEQEAWIVAKNNLTKEAVCKSFKQTISELTGLPPEVINTPPFYVVSLKSGNNGAAAILCNSVLRELSEKFGNELLVIPSSIHEVLVGSKITEDIEEVHKMIHEVNASCVLPEEQLSDKAYYITVA